MDTRTIKYTPGPWRVDEDELGTFIMAHMGGIASMRIVALEQRQERSANAQLIAAAPEMLKALKLCEQALKDHVQYDDGESLERDGYNAAVGGIQQAEGR